MAGNLTNNNKAKRRKSPLTDKKSMPFRIGIDYSLENNFCFKNMTEGAIKEFHRFIEDTIGKELTISETDKLFLRKRANVSQSESFSGKQRDILHYGKDRKPFRIFGYYNEKGYFVLTRIDPKHEFHKS